MGSDFFQEVDNDALFADVSVFCQTVTSVDQLPSLIEQAVNAALQEQGVAVLTLPGDVGGLDLPKHTAVPRFVDAAPAPRPPGRVAAGCRRRDQRRRPGHAARRPGRAARPRRGAGARRAADGPDGGHAQGEGGLRATTTRTRSGSPGLIGNHATAIAFTSCDTLVMLGTDFPYREFLPEGKTVVQLDVRGAHIGRRAAVDHALVGDARLGLQALLPLVDAKPDPGHLEKARSSYARLAASGSTQLADPEYERKPKGLLRRKVDNPEHRIRPELRGRDGRPAGGRRTRSSPPTPGCRRCGSHGSSG